MISMHLLLVPHRLSEYYEYENQIHRDGEDTPEDDILYPPLREESADRRSDEEGETERSSDQSHILGLVSGRRDI